MANWLYKTIVLKTTQEEHLRKGSKKKNAYDIVSFGSSYARYGFDFTECGVDGYNFGVMPQFLYYTFKMVVDYVNSYKSHAYVIIVLPDLVFGEPGKGKYGADRYAMLLSKEAQGDEYSLKRELFVKHFPLLKPSFHNIKQCVKNITLCPKEHKEYLMDHNPMNESQVEQMAIKRCNDWINQFGLKDTKSVELPASLDEKMKQSRLLLTNMIDFCLKEGLRPALVVTPVSRIMNSHLSDEFLDKVLFDNIRKANIQNVPMFNYMQDERFADCDNYINSADFLNHAARIRFTNIVVNDLISAYDAG